MKQISKKNQWLSNKPGISDPVLAPTVPPKAKTLDLFRGIFLFLNSRIPSTIGQWCSAPGHPCFDNGKGYKRKVSSQPSL